MFNVGDIIKPKPDMHLPYVYTDERMKAAKVIRARECNITIEIIDHACPNFINSGRYDVLSKYFCRLNEME